MKRITKKELEVFLRKHKLWLVNDPEGERADLWGANLRGADLRGADLENTKYVPPIACPEKGSFTAFKKSGLADDKNYIIELFIPNKAKRSSATSRKCRCDIAKVISITNLDGSHADITKIVSGYDSSFVYEVGKHVSVDNFDPDRWSECAPGIHFFMTRQEAIDY